MAATHKMVNGVETPLSPEEAAAIETEWSANEPGVGAAWLADQSGRIEALKAVAKDIFADNSTDHEAMARAFRSFALATLGEINALRQWITTFKAQTAAASNLANFQTRVANNTPNLPDRTAAQLRQVIRDGIDADG